MASNMAREHLIIRMGVFTTKEVGKEESLTAKALCTTEMGRSYIQEFGRTENQVIRSSGRTTGCSR